MQKPDDKTDDDLGYLREDWGGVDRPGRRERAVQEIERLRRAASKAMLSAKAVNGMVTINEWDAIALLHCLPDLEQVPCKEPDGSFTWATQER
jgi:hypothetical protein